MKEKIEKENIIKTKSEKGAITLFVLLACLFFVFTLTGVYISNVNRLKSQEQDIKQIQENYKRELDNIDEVYEEIASDGVTATLTAEPEEWTQKVTLKGTGEVKEGKDIEIVKYAFTKDQDMPLSTDWKDAEESEKIKIEKTEEVTEGGKYTFWVKDADGNIYKSNELEVKNIDKTLPTPGSIIAKKDTAEGEEYEFNKWTDTDVYVEKVNGTDGESGHKITTITVQKNGITMSEYTNVEGPITLTENGTYTITVTTEDNAGNKATSEPYIVKIDKVIPVLALKHNDVNGADYEQGTWTKDNLYGEITIDTSNTGKKVEKYQYSYNGITWKDISAETAPTSLDYTTTFPMNEEKPDWINGPTNNGTYYFEVQSDGTLKPTNGGSTGNTNKNTIANSYFELDLTDYPDAELEITINTTISSENNYDFGYATITTSTTAPAYNSSEGQFIKVSGTTTTADHTTTLTGGQKYYLHIGYSKDSSNSNNQDTFIINNITLKSDALGKTINFYNYTKQDNKISFTLQDNIDEEIYIRAVYNSVENDTSRYTGKQSIKIDKKAPVIESAEPVITSKTDAKININVIEDGSGLKGYYISAENVAPTEQSTWTEQILKEFTIEGLSTETTYYLWTIDNVGNISEKQEIVIGKANYVIDSNIYTETLEQAIEKATDGSIIQLLNDYTDTSTATFSKNITFDVQSYTLTREATITINSSKTVEITGTGKITSGTSNVYTITNNGTLTVNNSITIENSSTSSSNASIYTYSSSSITNINDNVKIVGYYKGIYNYYGTVNVNGGYIEATYQNSSAYGIYNYSRSSVKTYIKGGEIRGYKGIYNGGSSILEVTKGKVVGTGAYGVYAYGTTNIYGGRIEGKTYGVYSTSSNKITLGRQEDELSTTMPAVYGATYGIYLDDETYSFNFYNGKIISNTKETAYRGQVNLRTGHMPYTYFDYDIEQRYCTILTPTVENITMEATPTEFTNGNVTVKITYPYNTDIKQYSENGTDWIDVTLYNIELAVIENKTIYARTMNESGIVTDENQIVINNIDKEKPIVTVTPAQTNYVVTETNGTVDLNIIITAQDTGVSGLNVMQYAWIKEGEEPKYIDFNNTITIDKTKLEIGQYNLYVNVTDKAGNKADLVQMRYNVKYQEPVAQIGDTKYATIQEAIEACGKEAGETQTTITIIKSTDEEFSTYEGQNIILDLNGYTVGSSSTETPICTNNATLQIIDTSVNKTGKLESLNGTAIQNNGTFTLGDNSTSIENDTPTIYGYKIGIENNNIFDLYDGKIQGIIPIQGNVTNTPAEYGPVSTDYNNGITTIQLGIVTGYEARIGWVYYTTVQEAADATRVSAHDTNRDTVTLIKDIQLKESLNIQVAKNMILDLDRYILTITGEKDTVIENNGKLEIKDNSIEQTGGVIINSTKQSTQYERIYTAGIRNNNEGILIINSGTIDVNANGKYNYACGIYNLSHKSVVMNGGRINSLSGNGGDSSYGIYNYNNSKIKINAGIIFSYHYGIYNYDIGEIEILGGSINAAVYGIYNESTGRIKVGGGKISAEQGATLAYGIYNESSGSIEIKDGTISARGTSSGFGIYNENNGNIKIYEGTILGNGYKGYVIYNNDSGLIEIFGGTIYNSSSGYCIGYGIYNRKMAQVIMTGGNINITSNLSYGIYNEAQIEILGGNINSNSYGIYNDVEGSLTIGKEEDPLIQEKIKITGKKIGLYNRLGNVEFYNGMIQGDVPLNGNITKIRKECFIQNNILNEKKYIYLEVENSKEYIVQIDDMKYYSIQEAIDNISENEEKIICILKNIELKESITFNKNIIFDLNGYTITNRYYKILNIGKLKIIDSSENEQGKIECIDTAIGIVNDLTGDIIIDKGTITVTNSVNTGYGIYNSSTGKVSLKNGTISNTSYDDSCAIYNERDGIIEIIDGKINNKASTKYSECDSYGIYNYSTGDIYIYNGNISSIVEDDSDATYSVYGESYGIYNYGLGNITIEGGSVTSSSRDNSNSSYGIYNNDNGIIIIKEGIIDVTSERSSYGIENYKSGQVLIIKGTINSTGISSISYGIHNKGSGIVEITGGTVSSSSNYYYSYGISNNTGIITMGTKGDGLVSQEEPLIISRYNGTSTSKEGYGIYNQIGKFYFYDGKIEGSTKAISGFITEREENTELNYNEDETILTLITELIDIAQIGDITYKTIQEAIDAVGTEQTTIKILRNATFTINDAKIIIPNTKKIILDLNGYKLSSAIEESFIENNGYLEIIDTSEKQTGTLVSNTKQVISNLIGAQLILKGGNIENTMERAIYNEGKFILDGGKIIGNVNRYTRLYGVYNIGEIDIISGSINIRSNSDCYGIYNIENGSIEIYGGDIEVSSSYSAYGIYNENKSSIKMNGGIINCNGTGNGDCYSIYNNDTGTINIVKGEIICIPGNDGAYGIFNAKTGIITLGIKDNELEKNNILILAKTKYHGSDLKYGIYNPNGTLYYYDGTIQGGTNSLYGRLTQIEDLTELVITTEIVDEKELQTLTLEQKTTNAVTMNGTEYDSLSKAIKASGSEQDTIKLLRDVGPGADAVIEQNQNIIIDLNGYTLSNYKEITNNGILKIIDTSSEQTGKIIGLTGVAISNTGTMELNSGTITDSTYGIKNTGTINITGGKIENNTYGIYNDANANTTITNGEITSNTYGIYNYSSTVTANINGGTTSSNEYGIYNYNGTTDINNIEMSDNIYGVYNAGGTTNVNSTTLTGTTYGIYNSGGATNIKEGSQVQSQTGIYVANGTVNIGEQGTMNPDSPIIIGENFGLEVSSTGVVYMYDGQIKGKQGAIQGWITHTETGYAVANKVEGEYFVDYLALAGTISTVAEVNGISYSNLQSAINSVVGTEPQTVKLTNGIISTMTFNIAEGQNIILDMNGKTISSDLDVTMNNAGTLVIIDSASSGVAKISSTVGTVINNTGTLILGQDDGTVSQDLITIEGQTYGITTSGTLSFYDGTINGASAVNGTVTNRPSGYVIRTTTVNGKERYYLSQS